jgi:hypothetical protein
LPNTQASRLLYAGATNWLYIEMVKQVFISRFHSFLGIKLGVFQIFAGINVLPRHLHRDNQQGNIPALAKQKAFS